MPKSTIADDALLAAIMETSVAAICVLDQQRQIICANSQAADILGQRASDIVGQRYDALEWEATDLDGKPWPAAKQPFALVMSTGEPVSDVRHAIQWANGERKLLSINAAPIRDGQGDICAAVLCITDITERLLLEKKNREGSETLSLAVAAGQLGTWSWFIESGDVQWSDEVTALFGLEPGDFDGTYDSYLAMIHPEDRENVRETIETTLRSASEQYSIKYRLVRPDGSVRWIEARGRVTFDDAGKPIKMFGSVVDVTEGKSGEFALRRSEEFLSSIFETMPSYIVNVSRDRTIRFINRIPPHLHGIEIVGQPAGRFLASDSRTAYLQALDRVFESGEPEKVEARSPLPDGGVATFLMHMGPVRSGDTIESVTSVSIEITQLKQAQQAVHESREQLQHSQRLESIGRLAGGVAHDFNNLLTVVLGCANLARASLADRPDECELLGQIEDAAQRGADLTTQLLAFARKQVVRPRVVELNHLIADINKLLPRLIGEHIHLAIDLGIPLWPVEIDPGQFEQVIVNLAVNARDAMPEGGVLTIRTSCEQDDHLSWIDDDGKLQNEWVVVTVEDSGHGMDSSTLEQVFEPFFTTKKTGEGTGLGLATCFGIIRQAGGHIKAQSQLGEWSRFRIYLPRSTRDAEVPMAEADQRVQEGSGTVLLVEDDSMVRKVTRAMLEGAGYELLEARDGVEALEVFRNKVSDIDLLITDVVMPVMGGPELANELRTINPVLKILFVSGYSPDVELLKVLKGGACSLLQKPFTASALSDRVQDILRTD